MLASDLKRQSGLALGRVKFRDNLVKCTIVVSFSGAPPLRGSVNISKSCGTYRTALMAQRSYRESEDDGSRPLQQVV